MSNDIDMLVSAGVRADVASRVIIQLGGIRGVTIASSVELQRAGISPKLADRLVATFAMMRATRAAEAPTMISNAQAVYDLMVTKIGDIVQETFWIVALDARNRIVAAVEVARGGLTSVEVGPREVFRAALRLAAAGIVLVHNHPSGDPSPSDEDREITRRVREAGKLLGVPVVDHVVVASRGFYSFADNSESSL